MTLSLNDVSCGTVAPSLRHLPSGGLVSPLAESAVDLAAIAGLELDGWQAETITDSMRVTPDGRWAAREVGVVVGRQNGKGTILEARQLVGLFVLQERLQIHSAHEFKTCYEHFRRVRDLIESCPLLADELLPVTGVRTGAGDQAIETRSGCRLRFIARSRTSGVGFSADTVYLDEAFMLDDQTMGALLPTLSARPNSQLWYTSSAAHADSSVLHRVRQRAVDGDDPRLFYVEWGNERGVDPLDREAWARANPAMGIRISVEDIASEQRSMSAETFARERLGVPDVPEGEFVSVIPADVWADLVLDGSRIVSNDAWSVSVSPDRRMSSLGIAGRNPDGRVHVETLHREPGTSWVVPKVLEVWKTKKLPIRIHKSGPEAALIATLREVGVEVVEVTSQQVAHATGQFIDAVNAGTLAHLGQQSLAKAVGGAVLRETAEGAILWSQRLSTVEITPLQAITVALGGVPVGRDEPSIFVWQGKAVT